MNNANQEKVLKIIAEILEVKFSEIYLSTELNEDSNWDSLSIITFMSEIDSEFNIIVSAADVNKAKTVKQLCDLVN